MPKPLKLKVVDLGDLMVFAPLLQDAILRVRDLRFLKSERRFVGVANRFRWEDVSDAEQAAAQVQPLAPGEDAAFEDANPDENNLARQHMGFCFENVTGVVTKNLPNDATAFLTLLTITAKDTEATLHFAGDCAVRVSYRQLALFGEDLGEHWPTFYLPDHDINAERPNNSEQANG